MPKYNGLVIADIHVGASDLNKLHQEYVELFIDKIKTMKKLDFVVVAGDFFDHKFYLNDKEATMAYIMLKELVNACKEKDAVLRFVYGTESHECNQYDILSLLKIYDKIEVVKYAKEEELLPDLHVLYLPEEHILDKAEYYQDTNRDFYIITVDEDNKQVTYQSECFIFIVDFESAKFGNLTNNPKLVTPEIIPVYSCPIWLSIYSAIFISRTSLSAL